MRRFACPYCSTVTTISHLPVCTSWRIHHKKEFLWRTLFNAFFPVAPLVPTVVAPPQLTRQLSFRDAGLGQVIEEVRFTITSPAG